MKKTELTRRLAQDPVPGETEAAQRAWRIVGSFYAGRERVRRPQRRLRPIIALALLAAAAAVAVTPPGRAVVEKFRDAVGRNEAEPALVRLPAPGFLLIDSTHGPWVVHRDGSKRLLGTYTAASWSPRGLFVVATRGTDVVTLEPGGKVHWTVSREHAVTDARWAPSGFRIAYREGTTLRVVVGDGTGDRLLARGVAPVAPAWRPRPSAVNVVAYAAGDGVVHVVDVDTGHELWRTSPGPPVRQLVWSGRSLLVLSRSGATLYDGRHRVAGHIDVPHGNLLLDAAFGPKRGGLVYADFDPNTGHTELIRNECAGATGPCLAIAPQAIFRSAGRLEQLAWSPDERWLLVTWPSADQWLFLRMPGVRRLLTVSSVTAQFDPSGTGPRTFPSIAGWCCS